jgi:hypothetical protein
MRDSAPVAAPKAARPAGAATSGLDVPHPVTGPADSTALYRRPGTRPTMPAVGADLAPAAADPPANKSRAPDLGGEDAPSCLPAVNFDVANPEGMARLRHVVDSGLRNAVDIARQGVPHRPSRLLVPIAIGAVVLLVMWLLY